MDLSIKLTVQSKRLLSESNRYRREEESAAAALKRAVRGRQHAEAAMAAQRQANARAMSELYGRLSVQLDRTAGMARTASITGRIGDTLAQVTAQLTSAVSSHRIGDIETQLARFNEVMTSATRATGHLESSLSSLGGFEQGSMAAELMARAYDEAGVELTQLFSSPPSAQPTKEDDDELLEACKPASH